MRGYAKAGSPTLQYDIIPALAQVWGAGVISIPPGPMAWHMHARMTTLYYRHMHAAGARIADRKLKRRVSVT